MIEFWVYYMTLQILLVSWIKDCIGGKHTPWSGGGMSPVEFGGLTLANYPPVIIINLYVNFMSSTQNLKYFNTIVDALEKKITHFDTSKTDFNWCLPQSPPTVQCKEASSCWNVLLRAYFMSIINLFRVPSPPPYLMLWGSVMVMSQLGTFTVSVFPLSLHNYKLLTTVGDTLQYITLLCLLCLLVP